MGASSSISPEQVSDAGDGIVEVCRNKDEGESINAVHKFTELAYDVSRKEDTIKVILTNPRAKVAFLNFLRMEKKSEGRKFLETANGKIADEVTLTEAENVVLGYILPETEVDVSAMSVDSVSHNVEELLSGARDFSNDEIVTLLEMAKDKTVLLMALNALPRFISSPQFKQWRESETAQALATVSNASSIDITLPEILPADPAVLESAMITAEANYTNKNVVAQYLEKAYDKIKLSEVSNMAQVVAVPVVSQVNEEDVVDQALKHVDYLEVDRLLRSGSWLFAFIAAVENIPVCVTLSTARKDRVGFPLIYVNKYFEETTGYCRNDIMGANCKFLQRDCSGISRAESDSVERLSVALRNAEPIKVAMTNYRRTGEPFKNLLAMKPVFNLKNEYEYVIGVQFALSSRQSSSYLLRLSDSLMNLLPGVVTF